MASSAGLRHRKQNSAQDKSNPLPDINDPSPRNTTSPKQAPKFTRMRPVSEYDKEKAKTMEASPATPIPFVFNVQERIEELRGYLDPKNPHYEREQQHDNIRTVIKFYEEGKIDGSQEE